VTLKALANVSPGFTLKPRVQTEGGRAALQLTNVGATLSELRLREMEWVFPGLPKRNAGLELANAFSVQESYQPGLICI